MAISLGADALGLVSAMPSGPGVISEELIAEISDTVPPPVSTFLLTSKTSEQEIVQQHSTCKTGTIQIVDSIPLPSLQALRRQLPGINLVQVIHVVDDASVAEACTIANYVDAILLDSGNPSAAVKELGGTGRTHNWKLSRQIVEKCGKPVFLAGGLHADNIGPAWHAVRPWGFDICSGVRTSGALDGVKLAAVVKAIASLTPSAKL